MKTLKLTRRLVYLFAGAMALVIGSGAQAGESCNCTGPISHHGGQCNECCADDCCWKWIARADALILARSNAELPLVFEDDAGDRGAEVFNADDADLGWAGGPRLSLIGSLNDCYSLEIAYLGIDGWSDTRSITGDFILAGPGIDVEVDPTAPTVFNYGSDLYSAEFNIRRRQAPWLILFSGFRWAELSEEASALFTPDGSGTQEAIVVDTNNHLYGTQVGAEMVLLDRGGPLRVDAVTKAGIYTNNADSSVVDVNTGDSVGAESDDIAFLGEIGIGTTYRVSRCLAVRSGFQMIWLEGVALAPEQIAVSSLAIGDEGAILDDDGGVFYYGSYVGLEATW